MPEPVAISDALIDEGTPRDKPTLQATGRVVVAASRLQSSIAFCRYADIPAIFFSFQCSFRGCVNNLVIDIGYARSRFCILRFAARLFMIMQLMAWPAINTLLISSERDSFLPVF